MKTVNKDYLRDPEEVPAKNTREDLEIEQPERHEVEQSELPANEMPPNKNNEVETPKETEAPDERPVTLNNLDSSFIGTDHGRKTGRMVGHEPGPEYNL